MQTRVDEIAEGIYRLSTFLPAGGPSGFTFNQFLVDAEEPLLFHCGQRALFSSVSQAVGRVMDVRQLRWIAFSHVEADECGALAEWLAAAPAATVTHGAIGCAIWLNDQSPRPPRALANALHGLHRHHGRAVCGGVARARLRAWSLRPTRWWSASGARWPAFMASASGISSARAWPAGRGPTAISTSRCCSTRAWTPARGCASSWTSSPP